MNALRMLLAALALPATATSSVPGGAGPRLEYPLWLQRDGEVDVRVTVSPTLDLRGGGLRFGVSIGDEAPQVVTIKLDPTPGHPDFLAWNKTVSDSVHVVASGHRAPAGAQMLKLWHIDPGVVFQRVEIVRGNARDSYLGGIGKHAPVIPSLLFPLARGRRKISPTTDIPSP